MSTQESQFCQTNRGRFLQTQRIASKMDQTTRSKSARSLLMPGSDSAFHKSSTVFLGFSAGHLGFGLMSNESSS